MTFDALLAAHAPQAFRAAVGWLGNEQDAREAVQDALLKAYRARARYDQSRPFYPWLRRIVRNTCFDLAARRRTRRPTELHEERLADRQPTALDRLAQEEAIAAVRGGLDRLGEEHREILVLRHFEELSYAEIAQALDLPTGTVMSRLYRARRALVRALEVP